MIFFYENENKPNKIIMEKNPFNFNFTFLGERIAL